MDVQTLGTYKGDQSFCIAPQNHDIFSCKFNGKTSDQTEQENLGDVLKQRTATCPGTQNLCHSKEDSL